MTTTATIDDRFQTRDELVQFIDDHATAAVEKGHPCPPAASSGASRGSPPGRSAKTPPGTPC